MTSETSFEHTVYRTIIEENFEDEDDIDPENDDRYQKLSLVPSTNPRLSALKDCALKTADQLDRLQIPSLSSDDLYLYSLNQQSLLNRNLETLNLAQDKYTEKKAALALTNCQFADKLKMASVSSTPISVKTPMQHLNEDPFWAYKLDKMHQNMAVAQMGAAVVSTIETIFHDWFNKIKANISRVGENNPLFRRRCKQIANLGKVVGSYIAEKGSELVNITSIPELIDKAYAFYLGGKNNHSLADQLELQFDIPRELGLQYERNVSHILPYFTPFGTLGKMGKMGASSLKRGISFLQDSDAPLSNIAANSSQPKGKH